MATHPAYEWVEVTFLRTRGETVDFEFDLTITPDGATVAQPLDITGATVLFRVKGPVTNPATPVANLPLVINGTAVTRDANLLLGKLKYTPANANEANLCGDYLVKVHITKGGKTDKIPKGRRWWKVESGEDATAP